MRAHHNHYEGETDMIVAGMTERDIELEKNTIDLCSVCGRTFIVAEMSECLVHGYVCMDCDCACECVECEEEDQKAA